MRTMPSNERSNRAEQGILREITWDETTEQKSHLLHWIIKRKTRVKTLLNLYEAESLIYRTKLQHTSFAEEKLRWRISKPQMACWIFTSAQENVLKFRPQDMTSLKTNSITIIYTDSTDISNKGMNLWTSVLDMRIPGYSGAGILIRFPTQTLSSEKVSAIWAEQSLHDPNLNHLKRRGRTEKSIAHDHWIIILWQLGRQKIHNHHLQTDPHQCLQTEHIKESKWTSVLDMRIPGYSEARNLPSVFGSRLKLCQQERYQRYEQNEAYTIQITWSEGNLRKEQEINLARSLTSHTFLHCPRVPLRVRGLFAKSRQKNIVFAKSTVYVTVVLKDYSLCNCIH